MQLNQHHMLKILISSKIVYVCLINFYFILSYILYILKVSHVQKIHL